jgi:anti-anti-sigma factor
MATQLTGIDVHVVELAGHLDLATAEPAIRDALQQACGAETVVFEMSGVTFVDSQGLRALLSARSALQKSNRLLVLRRPPRNALLVMEVCGVRDLFVIEP